MKNNTQRAKNSNMFPGYNIRVHTPEGTIYVQIGENTATNKPEIIHVSAGKSLWPLQTMTTALANLIMKMWSLGIHTSEVIKTLDQDLGPNYRTNSGGIKIYSVPHGIQWALIQYLQLKNSPPIYVVR